MYRKFLKIGPVSLTNDSGSGPGAARKILAEGPQSH